MKEIKKVVKNITKIRTDLKALTQQRLDLLTKPRGSLGKLEELAKQIVAITGQQKPALKNKVIFTLAADHGVVEEGVSAFPQEVTGQMVYNFLRGGAGINVLARHVGARVIVVDMGVKEKLKVKSKKLKIKKIGPGTKNFLKERAMTRRQAEQAIEAGIELLKDELRKGVDIVGTGDMGIGNTTASSAIVAAITRRPPETVTGRGTGINEKSLRNKIRVIKAALKIHKPEAKDAVDVLSKVGGFEIGGLAGIILAAASKKIPVVIDGFISGAAALIAYQLQPKVKDYMIAAHCSVEQGHKIVLDYIGLDPLLDFNLRLGEGTGAALAMNTIEASMKILTEMASFQGAGVSDKD